MATFVNNYTAIELTFYKYLQNNTKIFSDKKIYKNIG